MAEDNLILKSHAGLVAAGAVDAADDTTLKLLRLDDDKKTLRVGVYVYDPNSLEWVKMVQPAETEYARLKMYEYSSGRLKYVCKNNDIDANETDTDWNISKFTDADSPEIEKERTGAVNTELVIDGLSWNI